LGGSHTGHRSTRETIGPEGKKNNRWAPGTGGISRVTIDCIARAMADGWYNHG